MKKRKWIALIMLLGVVVFAACNNSGRQELDMVVNIQDKTGEGQLLTEQDMEAEAVMQQLVIYYSNAKANGLETELVETEEITPEIIISYLLKHNIVSIGTKVNQFEIREEEGSRILILDLSKAFSEYLKTMGSSGEAVIMAALTDTFLEAYEAEGMKVTVEGKAIETNHVVYDGLFTFRNTDLSGQTEN